tara:strand:+ start:1250 stop:1600 length:351 start_codon:yes stop_codon:yes gene_type:complete
MIAPGLTNNKRRNFKIAAFIFGALVFLGILIYVSLKYSEPAVDPEKVTIDGNDILDIGFSETGEMPMNTTDPVDPVDPVTVSLAADGTDEIGLPGDDGPPEDDMPQHPYRVEQESS